MGEMLLEETGRVHVGRRPPYTGRVAITLARRVLETKGGRIVEHVRHKSMEVVDGYLCLTLAGSDDDLSCLPLDAWRKSH